MMDDDDRERTLSNSNHHKLSIRREGIIGNNINRKCLRATTVSDSNSNITTTNSNTAINTITTSNRT